MTETTTGTGEIDETTTTVMTSSLGSHLLLFLHLSLGFIASRLPFFFFLYHRPFTESTYFYFLLFFTLEPFRTILYSVMSDVTEAKQAKCI